jgi:glycosyltransferase involved in cell wall biosynthesis
MIGVVTTSYPRGPEDWAGAFVRQRVRALIAGGSAVEVVAAGEEGVSEAGVVRVAVPSGGVPLFDGPGAPEALEGGGARALVSGLGFTARLAQVVADRARGWEAIESHWLVPCALVAAAVAPGLRHRAVAHGGDVALLERLPGGDALARWLARSGARLVFASADLRARFRRLCGPTFEELPAEVEPASIDDQRFAPVSAARRAELRRSLGCVGPVVLAVGRLVPVKGFDVLVRAVARLPRPRRPRVVVLGEGPERGALARLAHGRLDLQLPGAVSPARVAEWMAAADLYVQPSRAVASGRAEGMPLAVREALAAGLPAIASDVGGLREIDHARLVLIAADRPDLLARQIATFL